MYNFRLETDLINKIDKLNGTRTSIITNALQQYIQTDTQYNYNVNINYLQHLEQEIQYLRSQVNGLMLAKIPLLSKIKMKLLENKTS